MRPSDARVLVIGVGGLGAPALLALASAGVRRIGVLEPDRVELSNLHRQITYAEGDVGQLKAEVLRRALERRFTGLELQALPVAFDASTVELVRDYHVVLDGTDRFETKLAISDACVDRSIPYVFAGVVGREGQVMAMDPDRSACLRCLFDESPPPGAAPTCETLGILGPIAGWVAAHQVRWALRLLAGDATVLDRIWIYDGQRERAREVVVSRASDCRGCGSRRHLRGVTAPELDPEAVRTVAAELDLTGLVCPETYVRTRRALEGLPHGGRLWVRLGSDESARNVPASALAAGHRVLAQVSDGSAHRVLLQHNQRGED